MDLLKVFAKLWRPARPLDSAKAVQISFLSKMPIGSAWNFTSCEQNQTTLANTIRSTESTDGQNISLPPVQPVSFNNVLRWINSSSVSLEGCTVLPTKLPTEIQQGKLVENKFIELPKDMSNATFYLENGLDHIKRTTLNSGDHNAPLQRRLSSTAGYTDVSCFSSLSGPKHFLSNNPGTFAIARKHFSTSSPQGPENGGKKALPRLILIRNPLTWLSTKFDFRVLKSLWDPQFVEDEFKEGTVKAISTVTQILSDGKFEELVGLLTKPARACLLKEIGRSWPGRKLKLIALSPGDIQISVPRKVYFLTISDKKFCDVDMAFMALKWISPNRKDGMVFAEIFARFHREYTQHCIPEWTIAYFKVTRFDVLKK